MNEKPFLNFGEYKEKLPEWQNGSKFEPNVESDMKCKKFLADSVNGDDILRKMLMLNLVSEGVIPDNIAQLYIMRRLFK